MRKTKRGFTIVELVIVIAVIGVLTAVLVPTFIHLSNKAKKASDESLVHNLNTALSIEYAAKEAPATMDDAIEGLKHQGYVADVLVAKAEKALVYNLKENKFELESEVALEDQHDYWKIVENEADIDPEAHWSVYAKQGFVVDGDDVEVHSGFDAGKNAISSIKYTRDYSVAAHNFGQEVVIRTNDMACDVTINAAADTVHHYGDAQSINIIAVANASYHEHGSVPFVEIATGRIVVESKAVVEAIHLNASGVVIENKATEEPAVTATTAGTTYTAGTEAKTVAEASDKEDVKEEVISNSDLVFQVKGSWAGVAAEAKALMQDYVAKVYNKTSIMTETRAYTLDEIYNLFPAVKNYFVEVGSIHINVGAIKVNGVEISAQDTFGLSVGSSRRIAANYYKIENGKLYLAAPVAAFELMTNESLVINKTTVALGENPINTLSVLSLKTNAGGVVFEPHSEDAYTYDIDRSQLGGVATWGAFHNRYLNITFNEVSSETTGIYVTRTLFTYSDGSRSISYGTSTIDKTADGYGVSSYVTSNSVAVNWKYSSWFTGIDKVCTLNFNLN